MASSAELPPTAAPPPASQRLPSPPPPPSGDKAPPKKTTVRKRTKTGCLTCRRRRIKCDEGKPTCNNCIKSRRECEGYSQRLTFKEPLGSFPSGSMFGRPVHHRQGQEALANAQLSAAQAKAAASQGPLAAIAPKPPSAEFVARGPVVGLPQHLPTPPLGDRDAAPVSDQLRPLASAAQPAASGFSFEPPATAQAPQSSAVPADVPAAFSGHHVPMVPEGQPVSVLCDGGGEASNRIPPSGEEYWESDDEASMAESNDDDVVPDPHLIHLESNDLGIQVARRLGQQHDPYGVRIRSFDAPVDRNVLATYMPSSANSPLNDSQTAAVFWYFVNVTGQSMSLYERRPSNPAPMFQGDPVPKERQHIWTYTFPIMAFNHPALMQAMLALGSLQMAKLQGCPPTAAMKHYHLSLRRIAKNYQSPTRRTQPATLAATLLLGFYEVWNSDHDKWCKHMWGARAILRDIPLSRMTRDVLAYRRSQREQALRSHQCSQLCFGVHGDLDPESDAVDTELISQLTGQKVDYGGGWGRVLDESSRPSHAHLTERDVETYEHIRDLYWWFCKMDAYQSFLGGTRLQMEYRYWTQCVPRGPIGRIDCIYGTFDYLLLLLGRLADFASRDLARKRKARKAQAPAPAPQGPGQGLGQGPGPGPGPGQGQRQGPGGGGGQPLPSFPGLMPSSGRVTIPRGFSPPRETSPPSDSLEDVDLGASTAKALREWEEIRQAFEVFRARLGPDFAPMGPDVAPPEMTPFGPALMYRTYSIAGIWMNYYMGLIVLYRAHPSMPPVAVLAAGLAAPQTARWANEIGRIAAGLHEDTTHVSAVSTLVGAAFIESSFCLFVAGVQFQDTEQRHWTIRRLRDIARLTGWQSARQIADGCEAGWNKAAELGRGPPYHSPPELGPLFPDSVWNRPRGVDRRIQELEANRLERRLVLAKSEQAHYAMGLLSVEQDLDQLEIDDGEGEDGGVGLERGVNS